MRRISSLGYALALAVPLAAMSAAPASASAITVNFIGIVGSYTDTNNVFGFGAGFNLAGQIVTGTTTVDSTGVTGYCGAGGACFGDNGQGNNFSSFTLGSVTAAIQSLGIGAFFAGASNGSVAILDSSSPTTGGQNYFALGTSNSNQSVIEQLALGYGTGAPIFNAYGDVYPASNPDLAYASLLNANGLTPTGSNFSWTIGGETIGGTISSESITAAPEPASIALLGLALAGIGAVRRRSSR